MCDMNCLECRYEGCINTSPATESERFSSAERDRDFVKVIGIDMTRYIHNRIDREEYVKARNREYDKKRSKDPKRLAAKKVYYLAHAEDRREYQRQYNLTHAEEHRARERARYEAHREEINARRRERYRMKQEEKKCSSQMVK